MKLKKVLLISDIVLHYRVSIYNYFSEQFKQRGYEFIVRSNDIQQNSPHRISFDFKKIHLAIPALLREIEEIGPDVVILFLHLKNLAIFPLQYWLRWKRIPMIVWTKGRNLDRRGSVIRNFLFNHVQNLSDGIILYSQHEQKFIAQKNLKKVTVANNTINYLDFPTLQASKEEIKKRWKIPFEKVALFTGRMDVGQGRKRVDHAIKIFRGLTEHRAGLIIVGSGFNEKLRLMMNPRNTIYLGEIHDPSNIRISEVFCMADVFLMPGHVGLGLNQAFFWGLPVLTEEGNQPPEIHNLIDGYNGYIVKENDINGLKRKLLHLFRDEGELKRRGENAKKHLLEEASIEGMFQGFYINVVARKRKEHS